MLFRFYMSSWRWNRQCLLYKLKSELLCCHFFVTLNLLLGETLWWPWSLRQGVWWSVLGASQNKIEQNSSNSSEHFRTESASSKDAQSTRSADDSNGEARQCLEMRDWKQTNCACDQKYDCWGACFAFWRRRVSRAFHHHVCILIQYTVYIFGFVSIWHDLQHQLAQKKVLFGYVCYLGLHIFTWAKSPK